ncbi:MAG: hypothetical protein ACOZAN_01620 [Patescibacteria group bacterium]
MSKPTITLTYNKDTHEFSIGAYNVLEVEYQLTYKLRLPKPGEATASANLTSLSTNTGTDPNTSADEVLEAVENGLGGAGKADTKNVFSEVVLAGTESGGDQFLHDPASGTLILQALTADDKIYKFTKRFVIDESGKIRFTSTEITSRAADGSILGNSTASANLKTATPSATPSKSVTTGAAKTETFPQHPPTNQAANTNYLGVVVGLSLFAGLLVAAAIVIWRKKKMSEAGFGSNGPKVYTHAGLGE